MKSQSWLPKEEDVRQLLCVDPGCQVCDAATLEIQHLLKSEKSQPPPVFLGLPQGSSCMELLPTSTLSSEENLEPYIGHSRQLPLLPRTPTLMQLPGQSVQLADAGGVQQCFQAVSKTMASSRLEEPVVLMIEEKIMQSKTKLDQESQDHHHLTSSASLLSLKPEIANSTHMNSVLPSHLPFLSPKVRRLLELHVKKWIHFQKWGLPRRVEESLRQFMPDPTLFCRTRKNPLSSVLSTNSKVTLDKIGGVSHQTNGLYLAGQPTETYWVSEWSFINLRQRKHSHQIHTYLASRELDRRSDSWPRPKSQANNSGSGLQSQYYSQLFCGLPSLHCESLDFKDKSMCKPSTDPHPSRGLSLPSLSKTPRKSPPPSSSASPTERDGAQIAAPILTLDECEALECHLLERQAKLQWGVPTVFLRKRCPQSRLPCELCVKTKTVKTLWPRKAFSHPSREFFFPEHARRLLEFHLQKQLIHLRWGLPQKIQRSIHLVLSSTEQQPLSCSSRALPNVSIPGDPKADGSGDTFSPTVGSSRSILPPHLFAQARAVLKHHIDSKCDQILKGKVPACVQSSWQGKLTGSLPAMAPSSCIPPGQSLKSQTENTPDLQCKVVPWKPTAHIQEKRALSGALVEHCKRPQALPEETIKKLETTLRHKYLAFLSGLPALYCVALSRPTSPAVTTQPRISEMMSRPVKRPPEAPTQTAALKSRLEPCTQGDSKASAEIAEESHLQREAQVEGGSESQPRPESPGTLKAQTMAKLNFYLKKKVLAMQFGVSGKETEYKELTVEESESTQEPRRSLSIPESPVLQEQPIACDSPPAPQANSVHLKSQQAAAAQAAYQEPKQPSPQAAPHGSAQGGPKASQFSRNMIKAQVPSVQMETTGEKPSPKDSFSTELQSPGKSRYSALVPTRTEKREEPRKPKAVGNLGEGVAGLGLFPASEKTHQDGDQKKHRMAQASAQHGHSSHLMDTYRPSPRGSPELGFPDPPPEVLMEAKSKHGGGVQVGQSKASVTQEPARMVLRLSQAFQDLPLPHPPVQGKPFLGQTWQGHSSPGQVMPVSPHTRPSLLPEAGLKNKVKSFLQSINPTVKGKPHTQSPTACTPGKVAKPSKGNAEKGLPQAKSPTRKTKTENSRGPKAQSATSEKSAITPLTASHNPDSKFPPPRARQLGSASVPGQPRHCPRHCPKLSGNTQHRNPR